VNQGKTSVIQSFTNAWTRVSRHKPAATFEAVVDRRGQVIGGSGTPTPTAGVDVSLVALGSVGGVPCSLQLWEIPLQELIGARLFLQYCRNTY
jgi:hypothetical protein